MAKRFMVEQYGPCPSDHETVITERDRWDEKLGLVILALEFAEKERGNAVTKDPVCPACGESLEKVERPSDSYLNEEQFASVRNGDWFCKNCRDLSTRTRFRYWWDHELKK